MSSFGCSKCIRTIGKQSMSFVKRSIVLRPCLGGSAIEGSTVDR